MNSNSTRAAPTGDKYDSVGSLMKDMGFPKETHEKVARLAHESCVATRMAQLRHAAGITQKEMADKMGITQPAISKLEAGKDDDIRLWHLQQYACITGERIGLNFGKPLSHTEAVRLLGNALKFRLDELAKIANQNLELQVEIKGFLAGTFSNLFNIIALCNNKLPVDDDDEIADVRMEFLTGKKMIPETGQRPQAEAPKEAVEATKV